MTKNYYYQESNSSSPVRFVIDIIYFDQPSTRVALVVSHDCHEVFLPRLILT
jgi:DNA-dependent RNA polymerase auxiliary subunit epsilon